MEDKARNTQNSYLKILNPVICVSKFLGVSPLWIHKNEGREMISVSSSFTVLYSYVSLVSSVILQALAVKELISRTVGLAFISWFLSVRIILTSLLNYR